MDKENSIPSTSLVGLQGQLNTVRSEIVTTNVNLQGIGRLIQSDSLQDQRKLLEEREQEKKLLELKIRKGARKSVRTKSFYFSSISINFYREKTKLHICKYYKSSRNIIWVFWNQSHTRNSIKC